MRRYATLCSGIEAPSVAWHGWEPVFFSEINPFCNAVLAHHYPDVPNVGNLKHIADKPQINESIDILFAGTPCQSFSYAGLRKGLDDHRGNLALQAIRVCAHMRPQWFIWENVAGVLDVQGGKAFSAILGALAGVKVETPKQGWGNAGIIVGHPAAYGLAWRVLDAKYFGVAQQRRRVFVVGYCGDWRSAAQVLFEQGSMRWYPRKGIKKRAQTSDAAIESITGGSEVMWPADVTTTIDARFGKNQGTDNQHIDNGATLFVMATRQANTEILEDSCPAILAGHERPIIIGANLQQMSSQTNRSQVGEIMGAITTQSNNIVFQPRFVCNGRGAPDVIADNFTSQQGHGDSSQVITVFDGVRRIMPLEVERLFGFPDNYTAVIHGKKPASDNVRYQALGNSIVVPVLRWIKERIEFVENL